MSIGRSITKGIEKIFSVAKRRGLEEEEKRQLIIENITKELSKFSNEDLEKITMLAKTTRAIQKKDAKAISEFISKSPKEKLDKVTSLAETTKDFKEKDVKAIAKFVNKISKENLEKFADIAEIVELIQEKDAKAIFEFISKAPKRKLEKIAILAGIARSIPELKEIKIAPESGVKFRESQGTPGRLGGMGRPLEQEGVSAEVTEEIKKRIEVRRKEVERMGLSFGIARVISELEILRGVTLPPAEIAMIREETRRGIQIHRGEGREISKKIEILFKKGVMLLKLGKYEEAYEVFNDIISKDKNLKGAWLNRGVVAGGLGKTKKEIYYYGKALKLDQHYIPAITNLALTYKSIGNNEEANKYFEILESLGR